MSPTTQESVVEERTGWAAREHEKGAEMTRDPIFLLQVRQFIFFYEGGGLPDEFHYCSDCAGIFRETEEAHEKKHEDENYEWGGGLTVEASVEAGLGRFYWETDLVFFSRREGERYAEARAHNYGPAESGRWRVYCVPAEGALALILDGKRKGWLREH